MRRWHRKVGVRVFVLDEQNRILLVETRDPQSGGCYWILPGGGIEDGEQAAEAAVREVAEESGVRVSIDRLLYVTDSVEPAVPQLCYTFYFLAHPVRNQEPFVGSDPERPLEGQVLTGARFFRREELAALPRLYPTVLREEFWRLLERGFGHHHPYRPWPVGESF
ncbi:MAG: NUDIX domain-containing protein [Bacillota bacterium]